MNPDRSRKIDAPVFALTPFDGRLFGLAVAALFLSPLLSSAVPEGGSSKLNESAGGTAGDEQSFTLTNFVAEPLSCARSVFTVRPLPEGGMSRVVTLLAPSVAADAGPMGFRLQVPEQGMPMTMGAPDVPTLYHLIPGLPGYRARIEVESVNYRDVPDREVAPVGPPASEFRDDGKSPQRRMRDESIYALDAFWPPDVVSVVEATRARERWTRLAFQPVQYNPRTRTVRYVQSVSARIFYEASSPVKSRKTVRPSKSRAVPDPFDCPPLYPEPILPPMNGLPTDFTSRRAGEIVDARFKITTSEDGIHKVTQPELLAAGVNAQSLIGSQLRLFGRDREMAIEVSTEGFFSSSDFFLFYQEDYDGRYSGENVCWFGVGGAGLRMETVDAQPVGGTNITTYHHRETLTQNNAFRPDISPLNEDWDHWYDSRLFNGFGLSLTFDRTVAVNHLALGQNAKICVALHASAVGNHNTRVVVNGQEVGAFPWSGGPALNGTAYSDSAVFDASTLSTAGGAPVPVLISQTGEPDFAFLEEVTLLYPRELFAWNSGRISFTGHAGAHNYQIEAFPNPALLVLDCTDPFQPVKLTNTAIVQNGNGSQVRFRRDAQERPQFILAANAALASVDSIVKMIIPGLVGTDQQADYIVICPEAFRAQADRLVAARSLQGQAVVLASIEEIYNEFCYGLEDASAIRQFLGYAFHHWEKPEPQRVVILGDASYDPREFLGVSTANLVPTPFGGTPSRFTGLDVRAALVSSAPGDPDILADLTIGRIPARTSAELEAVIDKILAYEALSSTASFRNRGVLVAGTDNAPTDNFDQSAETVAGIMVSQGIPDANIDRLYPPAATKTSVLDAINDPAGHFVFGYFGHGPFPAWDFGPFLLETSDIPALPVNSDHDYPIFTATTSLSGYYLEPAPSLEALAEVLLLTAGRGGIAVVAGTAPSPPGFSDPIANGFYDSLFRGARETLGETMLDAYLHAFAIGATAPELVFYQLFGDPGLIVNKLETLIVDTAADENDGSGAGGISLRDAINEQADIIQFASGLSGQTIALNPVHGGLVIAGKNVRISATMLDDGIKVSGSNSMRVFAIAAGTTAEIRGVTITGGSAVNGAGLLNSGMLTMDGVTVTGNAAATIGGGLHNSSPGTLTLRNTTVIGNSCSGDGGGISSNGGSVTLNHVTVSKNVAIGDGGGIRTIGGSLTLYNSIVAQNIALGTGPNLADDPSVTTSTSGVNLLSDLGGSTLLPEPTVLVGLPHLAPLGDYGGPTETAPPLPGSPAIEGAVVLFGTTPGTDQRGNARPTGPLPDIGAVEAGSLLLGSLPDTDNDDIPDLLEGPGGPYPHLLVGTDDSGLDFDGDGRSDAQELADMTDLFDGNDQFRILGISPTPAFDAQTNPLVAVTLSTFPGLRYSFESDVTLQNFQPLPGTAFTADDFTATVELHLAPNRDLLRGKRE